MSDDKKNLYYLEELSDYKVATDDYDVRDWEVIDAENRTVGKVTNLLANKSTERVVYLDVQVNKSVIEAGYDTYQTPASEGVHGFLNEEGEDHLIVPIGMVKLNPDKKEVHTNQIDSDTFAKTKRFKSGATIDEDYELIVFRHYLPDDSVEVTFIDDNFYNREEFKNSLSRKDS